MLACDLPSGVDPGTGEMPVSRVVTREEAYRQFDPNLIPDLFVANNPGYRVSWRTFTPCAFQLSSEAMKRFTKSAWLSSDRP